MPTDLNSFQHDCGQPTTPLWRPTAHTDSASRKRTPLIADTTADVCIIGAGIAGLSTAYELALRGQSVLVLDDGPIGGGQTERTSAHLSSALDDRFCTLEKTHSEKAARLAAESHAAPIDAIESIVARERIDCDFQRVDGYLFAAEGHSVELLHEELCAARRAGLEGVELVDRTPWHDYETGPAIRFPRQAQFHPLDYLHGLAGAIERLGGKIHTSTRASKLEGGASARVETANGPTVSAKSIVVATNSPINDLMAIHTKQAPYATYVVAFPVARQAIPRALYWDTLDAYHYIRLGRRDNNTDLLIVGGEDHKLGQDDQPEKCFQRLEAWARTRFRGLGQADYQWSGICQETTDGLAFIGRNPMDEANVYIATGDSGMGLTHGTIAGLLLSDLICGHDNAWSEIYEPSRKPVWGEAGRNYVRENVNVATQYAKDWLGSGDVNSADEIPLCSGALLRRGLKQIAVYRDAQGCTTEMSAVCPHLQCIVHWNRAENCWDCPCHGSRFSATGEVLNGPANSGLERLEPASESVDRSVR